MKRKASDAWVTNRALAQKVRAAVLQRDGYQCRLRLPGCLGRATEVDHIVPRAAGGPVFDLDNLRAVCASCHRKRPPVNDPCRVWPHLQPGDPPCPRCGAAAPSRDW